MYDKTDKLMLRQIVMEHFTEPDNKEFIKDNSAKTELVSSTTCSDEIKLQIKFEDNKIKWLKFEGQSCAISAASTDILCNQLKNLTLDEGLKKLSNFHNLIVGEECDEGELEELIAFCEVYRQGNRINCALLGANGIKNMILKEKGN